MPDLSTCNQPTCAVTVEGNVATCPKCGGPMRAVRESRARGWILLVLGLFLIVFMGVITLNLAPSLLSPGETGSDGSSFTGTADQARTALGLFLMVILFGFVATANGVYIIRTGRQSWVFIAVTLAVAAVLGIFCYSIMGWKTP